MQAFSSVLSELYQASESFTPPAFQQETFRLLRQLVFFDGAIGGNLSLESRPRRLLHFSQVGTYGRQRELAADYQAVADDDPAMRRLLNGTPVPYSCSCLQLYRERQLLHLYAFAKKHEISEVLIFGQSMPGTTVMRWVSLLRRASHPFDAEDAMTLGACWPHLLRASQINLRHTLESQRPANKEKAVALINAPGRIETGDRQFSNMLCEEWPHENGKFLPRPAWEALQQKGWYKGRTLSLSAFPAADYMVCEAQRLSELDRLGALERSVAFLVAEGHDYKTIAARMGTSPNTVRNQISRIYKKLNVHDKLSLALLFRRADPTGPAVLTTSSAPTIATMRTGTHTRSLSY